MPTRARDIVLTPSTAKWLRRIGVWQMAGGALSVIAFLDGMRRFPNPGSAALVAAFIGVSLALLAIIAGRALYQLRAVGLGPSMLVQVVQLVGFATPTSLMQLTLGPCVYLTIRWSASVSLQAAFQPTLQFHFDAPYPIAPGVAVNLLACFCFLRLLFTETALVSDRQATAAANDPGAAVSGEPTPAA